MATPTAVPSARMLGEKRAASRRCRLSPPCRVLRREKGSQNPYAGGKGANVPKDARAPRFPVRSEASSAGVTPREASSAGASASDTTTKPVHVLKDPMLLRP